MERPFTCTYWLKIHGTSNWTTRKYMSLQATSYFSEGFYEANRQYLD